MSGYPRLRMVSSVINSLPKIEMDQLHAPIYRGDSNKGIALAVESMSRHTSDEGWQIMQGLWEQGYALFGHNIGSSLTDVPHILRTMQPGIVVVQDKREWEGQTAGKGFNPQEKFIGVEELAKSDHIFKLTILKDAHQKLDYHKQSAEEMGCHAWIVYYNPRIVAHLAPYVRPQHLIRTYHSIDPTLVPDYSTKVRGGCLLSGAVSGAYPLRSRLIKDVKYLPATTILTHPGYRRDGCHTPKFIQTLSHYKVAICTSSIYGYALRKIVEATACRCMVITDLPSDEVLPEIDDNLVRIPHEATAQEVGRILTQLYSSYSPEKQNYFSEKAKKFYDYREVGKRLAYDIERMRLAYKGDTV